MMPDVCKTPMGGSTPPVPYPVTASLGDSQMTSKTVFANGNPIVRFDSSFAPDTIGDQAGVAHGIESGTVGAKCWPIDHSKTVRVESKMIVRHSDQFWMNGNYVGKDAKAARWRGRKAQIAEAKEKVGSLPPGAERDKLQAAANRFETNNSVVEQAKLAQNVYNPKLDTPEGWNNVSGDPAKLAQYKLKSGDFSIPGTNFRAQVYEPDKDVFGSDFKPQVVFQGTDKTSMSDWKNNLLQGMNKDSAYYSRAVSIGKALAKSGADVDIVGHSLGGGMASAASRTSGLAATTFNSAGLNPSTVARYGGTPVASDIQAYRVEGEVLTAAQEKSHGLMPTAVGEPHILPGQGGSIAKHGMDKVIDGIEQQKTEDQTTILKAIGE